MAATLVRFGRYRNARQDFALVLTLRFVGAVVAVDAGSMQIQSWEGAALSRAETVL